MHLMTVLWMAATLVNPEASYSTLAGSRLRLSFPAYSTGIVNAEVLALGDDAILPLNGQIPVTVFA